MPRNVTVTFADGTQHIYQNAPDNITPEAALARAQKDYGDKKIVNIDGGKKAAPKTAPKKSEGRTFLPQSLSQLATETGQGLASIGDTILSAPGAILQLGETMGRRAIAEGQNLVGGRGETPEQSRVAAQQRWAAGTAPVGTLTGVKGTPGYENEASRQILNFIGENVSKGAKWLSAKTGIPEVDIENTIAVLGFAAPAATSAVARRAAPVVAPVIETVNNKMVQPTVRATRNVMTSRQPAAQIGGMGAADTAPVTQRLAAAEGLREPVELTAAQATRDPGQWAFESETAKTFPKEEGAPLVQRQAEQNRAILRNFDLYTEATGAERAGPGQLRPVGRVVDKALQDYANQRWDETNRAYGAARAAGEMEQPVGYQPILDYITEQGPTASTQLAPILQAVREQLLKNDPAKSGEVSLNNLERVREFMGEYNEPGTANAMHIRKLKQLIDNVSEGAGGQLYRDARALRAKYGREFENVAAVDRLLSAKGKYSGDRRVALEDVFDHVVMNSSLDEMRSVGVLLKKAGPEGQQAWRELQGQTIQNIRDSVTRSVRRDVEGNEIVSPAAFERMIKHLDADGKLDYLFGQRGAQELRDLRDTVINVSSAPPGSVNYSNTASAVVRALDAFAKTPFAKIPGVGPATKFAATKKRSAELKKKVEQSLYPNQMAPAPRNNMRRP